MRLPNPDIRLFFRRVYCDWPWPAKARSAALCRRLRVQIVVICCCSQAQTLHCLPLLWNEALGVHQGAGGLATAP